MALDRSLGERLHLLRLAVGWSAAECAYRVTLAANEVIQPTTWLQWERAVQGSDSEEALRHYLDSVTSIFGVSPEWLQHQDFSELLDSSDAPVLAFNTERKTKPD